MDFSNLPTYPLVANPQYSPNSEAFPSPDILDTYFTEGYATSPNYPFGNYHNNGNSYYCRATQSLDTPPSWSPAIPTSFTGTTNPLSNNASGAISTGFNAWPDVTPHNNVFTNPSPSSLSSPRGSSASPALSRDSMKHDRLSPVSVHALQDRLSTQPPPPPASDPNAKRKRGRPRLYRPASEPTTTHKAPRPQCMPHTEVERKYREKLNMELERLRRAVPILPQSDAADAAKPSKSMVLAVAIDYIKELERQRDAAVEEVERLGGKVRAGKIRMGSRDA